MLGWLKRDEGNYLGTYYAIYVGEQWEDHQVNWEWFYVNVEKKEILWMDMVNLDYYTLDKWRETDDYQSRMESLSIEAQYTSLNEEPLLKLSLEEKQITKLQIGHQNEYVETPYSGRLIPQKLVSRLEEVLYAYCQFGNGRSDRPYQKLLTEYGGGSYGMEEEEIRETFGENPPDQAFSFVLSGGTKMYLKCYFLEKGGAECYLESRRGEEWFYKGDFMTTFERGEVICYEGSYYYVGLELAREGDADKRENGIRIFCLDEQPEWENNLLIRYLLGDYVRVPFFTGREEMDDGIADYIQNLDASTVLEKDMDSCGNAEEVVEILEKEDDTRISRYYRADMLNTGTPLYVKKITTWNHVYNWPYLRTEFYLYDESGEEFILLDGWAEEKSYSGGLRREALWCENIGGRVYTFQLFRLEDYIYIFEVLLLEGEEKTILQREVWVPQREMRIEERNLQAPVW